jgi:hypothetical protein
VLPGTDCAKVTLPTWTYDASDRRIRLSDDGVAFRVPSGWSATIEQPNLVVVSSPAPTTGARPTFEVFASPVCKTYDVPRVHERVAARAMKGVLAPDEAKRQVAQGRWSAGLGGPVGRSIILFDVTLNTTRGKQILVLYGTDYGESEDVGVHAAAACPKERLGDHEQNACEKAYFEMLDSAD